ncbi:PREDICTED: protein sidekick-2-like, partial [Eurypyga helias]|uniref:protein sidekick-2-like n=1 Tax=Eurypyga helias TaxID=54383 RepID=UPI0005290E37
MASADTHVPDPAWILEIPKSCCRQHLVPQGDLTPCSGVSPSLPPSPSDPPCCAPAQKANPFYEEWWFLVVIALVGLIFILLLVFVLIIRGQSKKYAKKSDSGNGSKATALSHGEMVSLDEGSFPALELNNRRLSVKNSFCRKNGIYTR